MATIYDVAKEAKVSPSTVSRIINGERNVAPATADRVEAAIEKVGYVPRAVRPGRKPLHRNGVQTGMIDFLSLGAFSPAEMLNLPYFSKLLDGVMRAVENKGMDLVLSHCPHGKRIPPVLARRRADGVLLFGNPELYPRVAHMLDRLPVIWCFLSSGSLVPPNANYVLYDNRPIGAIAAHYLLKNGHQRTAVLNASPWHSAFEDRRDAFLNVLGEHGITADVIEGQIEDPNQDVTLRTKPLVDRLLALDPRPTGIFCVSDDQMLAALNELHRRGVEPGRDIELIGCNNEQSFMQQMHPRPATIDLKLDLVGRQAAEKLLWKMSHPKGNKLVGTYIEPELIPPECEFRILPGNRV